MVSLSLALSLLWPTSSPTVPTNCVGLVGEFVHFNKIMPAGEHMAVQNFITPFMAFQRYDDRGRGVGGANRERGWRRRWMRGLTSGHSAWFQRRLGRARIFIDVNNGAGEGRGAGGVERGEVATECGMSYVTAF